MTIGNWISLASMFLSLLTACGMWLLNRKTGKFDQLEKTVSDQSQKSIDERFKTHNATLGISIDQLREEIKKIHLRLERGDGEFRELDRGGHSLEVKMVNAISGLRDDLKEYVRQATADMAKREDIKLINQRIDAFQRVMASEMEKRR